MIVRVEYHFYLDYVLPRLDPPLGVHITQPDFEAVAVGWDPGQPLFIGSAEHLADAEFVLEFTFGTLRRRISDVCIDRLTVQIRFDADSDFTPTAPAVESWAERAVETANFAINHLRVSTMDPRVKGIRRRWQQGSGRLWVSTPYTQTWWTGDGAALPLGHGVEPEPGRANSLFHGGEVLHPEPARATWPSLRRSLGTGHRPALHRALLVDAADALESSNLRQAILYAASACEVQAIAYAEGQTLIPRQRVGALTRGRASFADRYYHRVPETACGRSLKRELPRRFSQLRALFLARGSLMHGGEFPDSFDSLSEEVQFRQVADWLEAAHRATWWISSLPSEPDEVAEQE